MENVKLSDCIAPTFHGLYHDIKKHNYTHYWLSGGRGSTKSSFIGCAIPLIMVQNPKVNAVVMRKVGATLRDSVYQQILWSLDKLGIRHLFKCTVSPMEITYIPTGQKILFRGADDKSKIKSIKVSNGYIGIAWFNISGHVKLL